nr:leukocyte elastase inhibitor-like [Solea senegalensis]
MRKIKDLLAEGMVDDMSKLDETKPVKMMHLNNFFQMHFVAEFNFQILELPYEEEKLSMLIFLPMGVEDNSTGLEKLEKLLTYDKFMEWTSPDRMSLYDVDLSLPRFKVEEKYDMKDVLVRMGMVDAFDLAMCDLSGMSHTNDLFLSKVVHKAFVGINEEGTEAAGATAVVIAKNVFGPKATFIADHPFLFFIRHNATRSVLFAGRFCSPN